MKLYYTVIFLWFSYCALSQTPRIALVKPDGTTTIYSTIQAAYDASADDDYIYLPGGVVDGLSINKKIHIIGAGFNQDSSQVTRSTKISSFLIYPSAAGGSIEGIHFWNNCVFTGVGTIDGFEIRKCKFDGTLNFESTTINIVAKHNQFSTINGALTNSFFYNNVHIGTFSIGGYCEFKNSLFFNHNFSNNYNLPQNSIYKNNIFNSVNSTTCHFSYFYNNVNMLASGQQNEIYENISEQFNLIFENPGAGPPYIYDVHNDYQVKSTSACKNSGTDGTDRGIYGGTYPWVEGSIPSNPHIYFKQVAEETNANGQLQIHFKVRTN
ncbi:MAG: hypothetical protein IPL20_00215 [Saprospiraceae bacterium]|nr:hypothetical protein [Saprospiraceae bacterium]MBK8855719.1 hypothetical protein [Saprospiraceae bacterium]